MAITLARTSVSLDVGTLFVIAICVTLLLGVVLLIAWLQERVPALGWWGAAYLIGGFSGALWQWSVRFASPVLVDLANVLLFLAVGMIWGAARLFHGRRVQWSPQLLGAAVWLVACFSPAFTHSAASRIVLSSLIVATYTFLIAAELWHERRKSLIRRWPASFVPMLHGAIFLFPVALATLSPAGETIRGLAGWVAVFAIEILLYVIGAAFLVLILAKDRTVRFYKLAATTDPLTGVLNRRGFFEATGELMESNRVGMVPVSLLAFDLDRFKSINDQFGHDGGDAVLEMFAEVVRKTMRARDVIGRLGGEEFVAMVSGTLAEAAVAAERVRSAFATAEIALEGQRVPATVSIGIACGSPLAAVETLITRADAALYRAKANGRNRIEMDEEAVGAAPDRPAKQGLAATVRQAPAAWMPGIGRRA
ncbi:MAG: GGDEF domain-containing protein [Xanthobacteraceae bacterium]|jgi:diguanylate cyclase (GGDEF)-like protein